MDDFTFEIVQLACQFSSDIVMRCSSATEGVIIFHVLSNRNLIYQKIADAFLSKQLFYVGSVSFRSDNSVLIIPSSMLAGKIFFIR